MPSLFSGMKSVRVPGGGQYLPPDFKGIMRVKRAFINDGGFKDDTAVIAELECIDSNMPQKVPVGCSRSWYQGRLNDKKLRETALGEVLGFLAACLGYDDLTEAERNEIEESAEDLLGDGNPLEDRLVLVETFNKKTKDGGDFTKHRFSAVEQ